MSFETVQIGPCTLIRGDCLEVLPTLRGVDAVVTDPPYGIAFSSQHTCDTTTAAWMDSEIAGDGDTSARDSVLSRFDEWACFGSFKAPAPSGYRGMLIWDKGPASGMGDLSFPWKASFEPIYVRGDGWHGSRDEGVIRGHTIVTRASMGRVHPNEKPVSLIAYMLEKHIAETVLDPFMGSGTTGVACIKTGRQFIGIEIEPKYFAIACERIRKAWKLERSKLPLEPQSKMVQQQLVTA